MRTAQATAAAAVREAAHNRHATPTCATRPRNHGRPALSRRSRRDPRVLPAPPLDHHCAHAPAGVPVQLASTPSTRLVGRLEHLSMCLIQCCKLLMGIMPRSIVLPRRITVNGVRVRVHKVSSRQRSTPRPRCRRSLNPCRLPPTGKRRTPRRILSTGRMGGRGRL
jgi:hypothetical protein